MTSALPKVAIALVVLAAAISAQTGVDGRWETFAPGPFGPESDRITFDLKATGGKVTGTITRTDPPDQKPVAFEGQVEGNTIAFTVTSPDGKRTIAFAGVVKGDEIVFTREAKGTGDGTGNGIGIYGVDGPKRLVAKRFTPRVASEQTGVTGKWQGRSDFGAIAFDLRADGPTLTGTVSLGGGTPEPVEGKIDGDRITFTIFAGDVSFSFEGIVKSDRDDIAFSVKRTRGNETRFTAKRVSKFRGGPLPWQLSVYDRQGNVVRTVGEPAYSNTVPVLSPDGTRLAVVQPVPGAPGVDIFVFDIASGVRTRVFASPAPSGPVWSPDGTQIAYYAYRQGRGGLYRKNADGTGPEDRLPQLSPGISDGHLTDWSPDGRFLVFDTSAVVWIVPLAGERKAVELIREDFQVFGARFSSNSRFLAYVSDESGRNEVYVREFDAASVRFSTTGGKWRISQAGGEGMVHWRRDGRELYYLASDGGVMAVDTASLPALSARLPRLLFRSPLTIPSGGNTHDDRNGRINRDGDRFAFSAPPERKVITVAPESLALYTGTYVNQEGAEALVTRDSTRLSVAIPDGEPMLPTSETSFFHRSPDSDLEIDFVKDDKGAVRQMIAYRGAAGDTWTRTAARTEASPKPRGGVFPWQLREYDRNGTVVRTLVAEFGSNDWAVLSPDGTRAAVSLASGGVKQIRVVDVSTGTSTQAISGPLRSPIPVWSPDGRHIAFAAQREDYFGLYRKASSGMGREQLLYRFPLGVLDVFPNDWSSNGRFLAFSTGVGVLSVLPLTGERTPVELVREEFKAFGARFSPDSRFLAYVSDESGRNEVYVRTFSASSAGLSLTGASWQVSSQGGAGPVQWRRDGKELYYRAPDGGVMAVDVTLTPAFTAASPRLLFRAPDPYAGGFDGSYSGNISPDGRFLFRVQTPPDRKVRTVASEFLGQYTGTYVNRQGVEAVVTLENNQLMLKRPVGQAVPLAAESEASFFQRTSNRDIDIEFVKDQSGKVAHFLEYGAGSSTIWIRK